MGADNDLAVPPGSGTEILRTKTQSPRRRPTTPNKVSGLEIILTDEAISNNKLALSPSHFLLNTYSVSRHKHTTLFISLQQYPRHTSDAPSSTPHSAKLQIEPDFKSTPVTPTARGDQQRQQKAGATPVANRKDRNKPTFGDSQVLTFPIPSANSCPAHQPLKQPIPNATVAGNSAVPESEKPLIRIFQVRTRDTSATRTQPEQTNATRVRKTTPIVCIQLINDKTVTTNNYPSSITNNNLHLSHNLQKQPAVPPTAVPPRTVFRVFRVSQQGQPFDSQTTEAQRPDSPVDPHGGQRGHLHKGCPEK